MNTHHYFGELDPLRPLDWNTPVLCRCCNRVHEFGDLEVGLDHGRAVIACPYCVAPQPEDGLDLDELAVELERIDAEAWREMQAEERLRQQGFDDYTPNPNLPW
jgi:hypothetical protein